MELGYSLILGAGASLGLWQVYRNAPEPNPARWLNAGLWALAAALAGARLWYVLFNPAHYRSNWQEIPQVWLGGLAWPGAVAGAIAAAAVLSIVWKKSFGRVLDRLSPLLPPLAVAGWLGCWQSGCAYGFPAPENAIWGTPARGEDGLLVSRFPLQPLAAFLLLLVFFWIDTRPRWLRLSGQRAALMLLALGIDLFAASFLRADPAPLWGAAGGPRLRPDGWAALALTLVAAGLYLSPLRKLRRGFLTR